MKELKDYIIGYIENNKVKYDIEYKDSIQSIYELFNEIKKEYKELEEER